ncbi:unnamed protein product [Adineta steineri]|uniref:Uncharacterized protein n=1 Tax=Adineta steineri TaxID=433720 RepID=A0A819YSG9_9BILA|nr:unnamed protein product [Adineta steineri]
MALLSYTLNELLPLLPTEVHEKTVEIFKRVPGTLLKFFSPKLITKKAECYEHNLITEKSVESNGNEYWNNIREGSSDSMNKRMHVQDVTKINRNYPAEATSKKPVQNETAYGSDVSYTEHGSGIEYNKDWNNLRTHLRKSIKKMFHDHQITEVSPDCLANEIATRCLQECPNWGKQSQNSSSTIRFNSTYLTDNDSAKMNIHVYVYAHLILQYQKSFFKKHQYKTSYDLTIELNEISIDPLKVLQFSQLVAQNNVSDSIQAIKLNAPLTWGNL